jgi:hypothetical protein
MQRVGHVQLALAFDKIMDGACSGGGNLVDNINYKIFR